MSRRSAVRITIVTGCEFMKNGSDAQYGKEQSLVLVSQLISSLSASLKGILDRSGRIKRMSSGDDEECARDSNLAWFLSLL